MALPDTINIVVGTQIYFYDGIAVTAVNSLDLSGTTATITMGALGSGNYYESNQVDFGANRGLLYHAMMSAEWTTAPVAGEVVNAWIAWSPNSTAANGNPGGVSGSTGAYNGYGLAAADADEAVLQLHKLDPMVCTADTGVQIADLGVFVPRARYCTIVIQNDTTNAFTDDDEFQLAFTPLSYQLQD